MKKLSLKTILLIVGIVSLIISFILDSPEKAMMSLIGKPDPLVTTFRYSGFALIGGTLIWSLIKFVNSSGEETKKEVQEEKQDEEA